MKRIHMLSLLALCLLLSGCHLLEREYRTVEPHSQSYREDTDENAYHVSSYQDLVNTILLLVEDHQETGRIHVYENSLASIWEMMQDARREIMEETPTGAYSLERATWETNAQRDYYEVDLSLTYRRTQEEEDSIIDASSSNAVYDLIPFALEEERQCLAVRFAHLEQPPEELVRGILALQTPVDDVDGDEPESGSPLLEEEPQEEAPAEEPEVDPWKIYLYPNNENAGIVEIFFW